MASGLILLVIVGAWLVVLVPMALRSHDSASSLGSVDRFHDAMNVLSRRGGADRTQMVMPPRPAAAPAARPAAPGARPAGPSMAERRRRTLLVLLGLALLSLGLGMFGLRLLLAVHVVCDLLLVGFVVHCRRQAILRASLPTRTVPRPVPAAESRPQVAGIPSRMPARPVPLSTALPAPAARYEDKVAVASGWDPVPVPPPVYVGKPVAPPRPPRVLDLTKPGEWTATLEGTSEPAAELVDEGPELEEILERRRAANGW